MLAVLLALELLSGSPSLDPFAFLQPTVIVTAEERDQLLRGEAIARAVDEFPEVTVFAAVPVSVDGNRLVAWMRRIELLKKSAYVVGIHRLSDPPCPEDFDGVKLDDEELRDIRECHPGACGLKLSDVEMYELQRAASADPANWQAAVQQAFRRLALERVRRYLANGDVLPYDDQDSRVWPALRFARVLEHSTFLSRHLPRFAALLGAPPAAEPGVESFLYWSQERLAGKANFSITHVSIVRSDEPGAPEVMVAGKEIYSSHYITASLGLTALLRGAPGGPHYLTYLNRTDVDVVGGPFGKIVRWVIQRRLRNEAGNVLLGLKARLESGEPAR